jgi:hypothetical protein
MDETSLSGAKKFKVLKVPLEGLHYSLPLIVQEGKLPHLTGCITVSAAGKLFKPMVILPNLKKLKGLSKFTDHASFASSSTGWMTTELFTIWARDIVAQISWYRQQDLPAELRQEWIVIVLDGHVSRFNFQACHLLNWARIGVLLLPPHSTHVTQPVDVGLTAPVKTAFKSKLTDSLRGSIVLDLSGHDARQPLKKNCADELRCKLVAAFLHGIQAGCTVPNIRSAWEKSGLCPFCPERALNSQFVVRTEVLQSLLAGNQTIHQNVHPLARLNHGDLSTDVGLVALGTQLLGHPPTEQELKMDDVKWQAIVEKGRITRGKQNVSLTGMRSMVVSLAGEATGTVHIF